jgi:hypothetical protein
MTGENAAPVREPLATEDREGIFRGLGKDWK